MQTKQQIEKLLESAGISPNRRLGQHFLIDLNLMNLLIETARVHRNDVVLEVGCGTGSFTSGLAGVAGQVVAVEYDDKLVEIARDQLRKMDNVQLINADILESKNRLSREVIEALEEAKGLLGGRMLLVANLPYNVAASVMANLIVSGVGSTVCDGMYVTVQKEVAEKMVAGPGSSDYGTLSILMAATGKAQILRKLGRNVFWPRPQVDSAMVSFARERKKIRQIHSIDCLKAVVSLLMGHRRKMLKSCVRFAEEELAKIRNWDDIFSRAFVESHRRPEELSADDYICIANLCEEQLR